MGVTPTCLRAAAVVACMVAACLSGAALAQGASSSSKRDTPRGAAGATGAMGAPGAIVQYEEKASTGIVYIEEGGGMVTSPSGPVKAAKVEAKPAATPASAPRPAPAPVASSAAPGKLVQRRAPADAVKP